MTAAALIKLPITIKTMAFICSSRTENHGVDFAAEAALRQGIRGLAAEIEHKNQYIINSIKIKSEFKSENDFESQNGIKIEEDGNIMLGGM